MPSSATLVEPAFRHIPDYYDTYGPAIGELAALAGFAPDPEQQLCLDAIFARDRKGKSAAFEVCVICSRQNLKTGLFKQAALGKVFYLERPLFVWSAHEFATTQEAFRDLCTLIETTPELDRRVKRIYRGSGKESIELLSGQRIVFRARTKTGGRGLTGNDVLLDEGFALAPEHVGALMPTLSAVDDPQLLYGSSAGHSTSTVLRAIRDRGRAGSSSRLAYVEWAAEVADCADRNCRHDPASEGCQLDDEANWARSNPALGRRITIDYIRAERQAMPPGEFARERLGWWDEPGAAELVIPGKAWNALVDEASQIEGRPVFAFDTTPDREWTSIAAAGLRPDGAPHVEVLEHRRGTAWVVDRMARLRDKHKPSVIAVDGRSPAAAFVPQLRKAKIEPAVTNAEEMAQACGAFYDAVMEQRLRHLGDPLLLSAIAGATKRPLGNDAWAWSRKNSSTDISPLVAVTLAAHVFVSKSKPPTKPWGVLR